MKQLYTFLGLVMIGFFPFFAYAGYQDIESSNGNIISASSLDAEVTSTESGLQLPLVAENMISGDVVVRTGNIENVGGTDFKYRVSFEKESGDDALCSSLQLEAKRDGSVEYNGDLSAFEYNAGALSPDDDEDWIFSVTASSGLHIDYR